MFNFNHFSKYVHVWMNGMSVKNFCNERLSKTNFPLGQIKVYLILSYLHFIKPTQYLVSYPMQATIAELNLISLMIYSF